ncbi:unnamed protein product [Microthlaspi erraticum]|nr:unnamed protein product [Microthlaspi erraticum]
MIHAIFQCEGLFLCTTKDKRIVVWNPCTGQTRWIRIQPRNDDHLAYDSYALGYGNNKNKYSCDSFKILRCRTHKNNNLGIWVMEFELYYFNTDSWRLLDEDAQRNLTVSWRWMITSHGVSLKGNTYWVAWDKKEPNDIQFLLRFDFKRERFEHFSLPFSGSGTMFLSVVREEKLAVLLDRPNFDSSREMKIWVTDTKIDEAVTDMEYVLVVDFSRVLRRGMTVVSFLVDEENERVVCSGRDTKKGNKNVIYIVGGDGNHKHSCKQILGEIAQGPADDCWPFLDSYVPSSVQIQQVEAANAKGD